MTLRSRYRPMRPDLDEFLFAAVGDEGNGMPLSMISALTRLGLDPWDEAGRLSSLNKRDAIEQLARMLAQLLPGRLWASGEVRAIAGGLIELLPKRDSNRPPTPIRRRRPRLTLPKPGPIVSFWVICLILAATALISMIVHRGFPFGI
jgi:hypothetical protein